MFVGSIQNAVKMYVDPRAYEPKQVVGLHAHCYKDCISFEFYDYKMEDLTPTSNLFLSLQAKRECI